MCLSSGNTLWEELLGTEKLLMTTLAQSMEHGNLSFPSTVSDIFEQLSNLVPKTADILATLTSSATSLQAKTTFSMEQVLALMVFLYSLLGEKILKTGEAIDTLETDLKDKMMKEAVELANARVSVRLRLVKRRLLNK